jgi:hypothetical protein
MVVAEKPLMEWVNRVRAEYMEMPGLALTAQQMRRLWVLDASLCDAVVSSLVASGFLWLRPDKRYARVLAGH